MLIKILFPKLCISCSEYGRHLCDDCLSVIDINRTSSKDLIWAVSYDDKLVTHVIQMYKYPPFIKDLSVPLTSLIIAHLKLADNLPNLASFTICAMPLHIRRLKWRGFNQSQEISIRIANALGLPLLSNALTRTRNTRPQSELRGQERKQNIAGAFSVQFPDKIQKKNILLVDDVYTTGASMDEAKKTLKRAGAHRVIGVAVARQNFSK
jgi:ComF family protein